MELSLHIARVGDTTEREIAVVSEELRQALERLAGVVRVEPQRAPAPDQAKGGLVDILGSLLLSVSPDALRAAMQVLQAVLSRQPQLTKVSVQSKDNQISFEFDPKRTSLRELVEAAERLRAAAPPA